MTTTSPELDSEVRRIVDEAKDHIDVDINLKGADLQLALCRKFREMLPLNKDMLQLAQDNGWIHSMISWLNLHDRPAVQVEALLAVTSIAELCAQQSYFQQTAQQTSAVAAAAQAAVNAVKGEKPTWNEAMEAANKFAPPKYPYPSLLTPAPGSVPFPPISFSHTLSSEALSSFDQSLASTLQNTQRDSETGKWTVPTNPPYPTNTNQKGGINFTSLAPPPNGAHSSVPTSNGYLPPPTSSSKFPQNLTPSSQHLMLRHADAIPTLISLLSNPDVKIYEQAMWLLGSIAAGDSQSSSNSIGDKSVSARDVILAAGVMDQLLICLEAHPLNLSLQRIGSWTLSNLVEGIFSQSSHKKSSSDQSSSAEEIKMKKLLPVLKRLLNMSDPEVLIYTCWTLSHLCDGPSSHIAEVVSSQDGEPKGGLVPRLVDLLTHPNWRVTKPALRTIGNIVCAECGDEAHGTVTTTDYTDVILECKAVPRLKSLISHSHKEIQKEACWTLSNIAAGTVDQIQSVIDSGAIAPLVRLVKDKKTDTEVRSEACWVVLNATSCGCDSQIETLVEEGCVSVLGVLLSEATMVVMALEGLERVLKVEETRENQRREQIERGEIEDDEEDRPPPLVSPALIQKAMESHNSSTVAKSAEKIWKEHFVSCALCKTSFSSHRPEDASFCDECKCHVCSNCNCRIYHLDYQEELWAETEQKTEQKKASKKSKNKRKKEKLKLKKLQEQQEEEEEDEKEEVETTTKDNPPQQEPEKKSESDEKKDDDENQIDFVLYLQQTGSIIALAKLMDALEYEDEELDDYERRMIREQQMMKSQNVN